MKAATRALVFIVRIWHSAVPPPGFRAAVRAVDGEESFLFTDTTAIGDFFGARLDLDRPPNGLPPSPDG